MDMGMMMLSPGVQHSEKANLGPEMSGIGCNGARGHGCGPEQDVVDHGLVLKSDLGDGAGTCIEPFGARQNLALWTVPVAAGEDCPAGRASH
jgi:hypothetical protein